MLRSGWFSSECIEPGDPVAGALDSADHKEIVVWGDASDTVTAFTIHSRNDRPVAVKKKIHDRDKAESRIDSRSLVRTKGSRKLLLGSSGSEKDLGSQNQKESSVRL